MELAIQRYRGSKVGESPRRLRTEYHTYLQGLSRRNGSAPASPVGLARKYSKRSPFDCAVTATGPEFLLAQIEADIGLGCGGASGGAGSWEPLPLATTGIRVDDDCGTSLPQPHSLANALRTQICAT